MPVLMSVLMLGTARVAAAQAPTGYVSVFGDYFPNRQDSAELRGRVFVDETLDPSPHVRVTVAGFAEGLLARRPVDGGPRRVTDGIVRVQDASIRWSSGRADLLAGFARVTWGKLDEIQPTDVINPLDVSRFFFEGRSEARLPVLLLRGRVHVTDDLTIEGVYVPDFRRGLFDQLDEPTSPFNLPLAVAGGPFAIDDRAPAFTAANAQGGARVSATTGKVDWSVSAYRGFEPFGFYSLDPAKIPPPIAVIREYPRFTMIGGDFEAVRGRWGLRGELAAFVDDSFQSPDVRVISGHSIDAGVGVDRKAGSYTLSGTVIVHTESYDGALSQFDPSTGRTDVSIVGSLDRTFSRERYRFRGFGVYNATEASAFVRGIGIATLRDNLALEGSAGWFAGAGRDLVGRFGDSDFMYVRLKYYF
jgi:hypothetical protein